MITLKLISIAFFYAYTIAMLIVFRGVPVSYSETSYLLKPKNQWLFSGWAFMSSVPFCIYWFSVATTMLWVPIVVVLCLCFIGATDFYKPPTRRTITRKQELSSSDFLEKIKYIIKNLDIKEFFKYGWARPVHYICSVVAIVVAFVYFYFISLEVFITEIVLLALVIVIGAVTPGVYNKTTSLDVDNSSWIFFMELLIFSSLYIIV